MNVNSYCDFISNIVEQAKSQVEKKVDAFEVKFSSSAGYDYDPPSFDIAVTGITSFSCDTAGGEIQFDVSVSAHVDLNKYDGVDREHVGMGACNKTMETTCVVKYTYQNNTVNISDICFRNKVIDIDGDDILS